MWECAKLKYSVHQHSPGLVSRGWQCSLERMHPCHTFAFHPRACFGMVPNAPVESGRSAYGVRKDANAPHTSVYTQTHNCPSSACGNRVYCSLSTEHSPVEFTTQPRVQLTHVFREVAEYGVHWAQFGIVQSAHGRRGCMFAMQRFDERVETKASMHRSAKNLGLLLP